MNTGCCPISPRTTSGFKFSRPRRLMPSSLSDMSKLGKADMKKWLLSAGALILLAGCQTYSGPVYEVPANAPPQTLAHVHTQAARIKEVDGARVKGYQANYVGVGWGTDEFDVIQGPHKMILEWSPSAAGSSRQYETTPLDYTFKAGHSYLIGSTIWRYMVLAMDYDLFITDETDHVKTMLGGPKKGETISTVDAK